MNPIFEYSDTLNNPYEAFFFDAQKNNFPVLPHWHYFIGNYCIFCKGTAYIETDTDNYVLEPGRSDCFPTRRHLMLFMLQVLFPSNIRC